MPNSEPSVGTKDALRGFAAAAGACTCISLLRAPFDAYFSGMGLVRLFSDGVVGIAVFTVMAFIVISVLGLPLWMLFRRFNLSKWWHFVLLGGLAGVLLASRVNPNAYASEEYNRWARGQETIRPALDAMQFILWGVGSSTVFWAYTYRRRRTSG